MTNLNRCPTCGRLISVKIVHTCKPPWNKGKKTGLVPRSAFKKGHKPWNTGKHHSEDTKAKISKEHKKKGYAPPQEFWFAEGHVPHNAGTKGQIKPNDGSFKKGHKPKHTGLKRPEVSGNNHWNWHGGITSEHAKARCSIEYKKWRQTVFERDDFTCQQCGVRGGNLHAHHIKSFAEFPELRLDVSNGQTLCIHCHHKTKDHKAQR